MKKRRLRKRFNDLIESLVAALFVGVLFYSMLMAMAG